MKNNFITLIALVGILLFSNYMIAQSPTAAALGFNAFLQQGATLTTNESEGPIAIGGNLTVNGNYQVNIHSVGTFTVGNAPIGLFVGGQVILSSGSLQVNSGRYVKIGNCASSNIRTWYRDNNNATSNIYITGSAASYASTPNININSNALAWGTEVSTTNNPVCDANSATEINFATAFTTMQASATSMAACSTSGNILSNPNQNVFGSTISSVLTSGQVKITLASGTNVLNVSGADLNSVTNGITFTNSPDASHVLVINVNAVGSYTWNVWNQGGVSGNNASYIIYNFYNTTSLNIAGNSTIEGTVFAPNATITKTVNQSNIEGQVIGQSFIQNGGELHYYPFTPTVAGCVVSSVCSGFTTYTQGGWGAAPKGNNPGTILQNNFTAVYPSGVTIGCNTGYIFKFTSSSAITAFLPQGGTPGSLGASATNPTGSFTVLAGQVLAARLNVDFDKFNPSGYKTNASLLSGLIFNTGVFNGKTVQFVLDEANKVLGGCASAYSASDLNDALTLLNQNYDNGGGTNVGDLNCGNAATPVAAISGNNSVCFGGSVTLTDATAGGTWSSSDNTVATVSSGGVVTSLKAGITTITYSVSGYSPSATLSFTVKAATTSTTNASICAGGAYSFNGNSYSNAGSYTAHLTNAAGCDSAATLVLTIKQPSTSTTTASICAGSSYTFNGTSYSSTGSYTSHLTNSAGCDSSATLVLTVKAAPSVASINGTSNVCVGKTSTLTNSTPNGVWSSANGTIASISANGIVTAVAAGTINISYTVTNNLGCSAIASISFVVNPLPVLDTIVGNTSVCVGSTVALTNSTQGGSWSSFNNYVGSINASGVFTGNAYGTSAVTYTFTNNNGCTNKVSTVLSVNNNPYVGSIVGSTTVCTGNVDTLKPGASFGVWSASNNIVATISPNGYVSGFSAGKDTISYTLTNSYGCTSVASTVITVLTNPIALDTIVGNGNVCVGSTVQLSNSTPNGIWSSFDYYVGTITSNGAFTGNAYGTTNVTYFVSNVQGCTAKTTKVFSVFNKPYIGTLTGANIVCSGNSITLKTSVGGGIWSSSNNAIASVTSKGVVSGITGGKDTVTYSLTNSNGCTSTLTQSILVASTASTTNASICAGSSYSFNGTSYSTAGTYTAHLTNAAGCDSAASLVLTLTPLPAMTSIFGNTTLCTGTSTQLTDNTIGGIWASSDTGIATIDMNGNVTAIANGNTVITYTITATCSTYASYPIKVKCDTSGSVSSSGTGGLESKSLGASIGTRNFNIYKNSQNGAVVYTESQKIVTPKKGSISTFGINNATSLSALMPTSANNAYSAYDQSAAVADLTSITNAIDVRAIDFTLNNSPKAVAFATKTVGAIYSHTKTICDRLKGAQLLDVKKVTISNISFIQFKIQQSNGDLEYAISFSAGQKAGRDAISIQSNWLMTDYVSEDTMFNYQLWAANQADVTTMVTEVLAKLHANKSLIDLSNNDLPSAYVSAANRQGSMLNIIINNRTANTTGYFELKQSAAENSTSQMTDIVPFTINANGQTTVSIPVNDNYDANISMVFNNSTTDALYMADGIWGTSGDNRTTVTKMNVINNSSKQYASNEYPLLRDVNVNVTTPSYVSIYKYLKGGAAAVDLSSYKSFHFTAMTNAGGMNLKVTITKQSVGSWNSQYSYTISNFQNGQTYSIALSDFKSTDATLPTTIDASDITSVIYNVENTSGQTLSFSAGISNAAFSTEDIALERALEVKTVSVSPNPSNGNFRVSFVTPSNTQLRLAITDITGRIVSSQMVNAVTGTNEVSVNLGQSMNGSLYFISLQGADSKYITQRMMIKK